MNQAAFRPIARTEIARLRKDLELLFERAHSLDEADELAGDISRYLCIRISGYLEQALALCGRSLCARGALGQAEQFAQSWLKRTSNPRSDEIVKFVQRFDEKWALQLQTLLAEDERGQSINALLGIRNDVAHGKSQGMSPNRAWDYYVVAETVVEFVVNHFEPLPTPAGGVS